MLYLELQQQKSAKNPENYRWDGFANVWKPEGRLVQFDEIICMLWISVWSQSVQCLARRNHAVVTVGWESEHGQDGHSIPCLPDYPPSRLELAGCPSTWLLHQYNNELDIEGLLSAGESWPLMPRFGHLYTGTATMCHRHILWTALRFSGITWDYERAIIVTYSI